LITGELGRIPARGDTLSLAGMRITIDEVDERRVIAVRVVYNRSAGSRS
jgi:CBS domain containing-hemolysin-like protein